MKLIFLDIDGVLNSHDFFYKRHETTGKMQGGCRRESIDPDALRRLERIINETGAKIVISSSWRIGRETVEIKELLRIAGFKHWQEIIDRTPSTSSLTERRGEEIRMWLDKNPENIGNFIILDDDSDMDKLMDRLVHTDWEHGLTDVETENAIARLNE